MGHPTFTAVHGTMTWRGQFHFMVGKMWIISLPVLPQILCAGLGGELQHHRKEESAAGGANEHVNEGTVGMFRGEELYVPLCWPLRQLSREKPSKEVNL